jgi:hypothetical protein
MTESRRAYKNYLYELFLREALVPGTKGASYLASDAARYRSLAATFGR